MITGRSVKEPEGEPMAGGRMAKKMKNGLWRVYEIIDGWSQASGSWSRQGSMIRNLDGEPLTFETLEDARQWSKTTKLI